MLLPQWSTPWWGDHTEHQWFLSLTNRNSGPPVWSGNPKPFLKSNMPGTTLTIAITLEATSGDSLSQSCLPLAKIPGVCHWAETKEKASLGKHYADIRRTAFKPKLPFTLLIPTKLNRRELLDPLSNGPVLRTSLQIAATPINWRTHNVESSQD